MLLCTFIRCNGFKLRLRPLQLDRCKRCSYAGVRSVYSRACACHNVCWEGHMNNLPVSPSGHLTLAAAFEKCLEAKRDSWRELAIKIGVSCPTLRTWKMRNRFPRERAVEIARILQLPVTGSLSPEAIASAYDIGD